MFLGARLPREISVSFALLLLSNGCGSRTALHEGADDSVVPACSQTSECEQSSPCDPLACVEGQCVFGDPVLCVSEDPCQASICDEMTGECVQEPLTLDVDGDGYRSPLPGFAAGEVGACGLDCDDTSRLAFPGGVEVCDGVDNDCDGVVDNGEDYLGKIDDQAPKAIAVANSELDGSGRRGAAFGEGVFALGYWGRDDLTLSYLRGLDVLGNEVFAQTGVSNVNAPSFGPDLAWSGAAFGTVWSDPRVDSNYELYFARFNTLGEKLGPDLRLSEAPDFSIHGRLLFDQGRYVVVWDDRRSEDESGGAQIFAQLVSETGELLGNNIPITDSNELAEYPSIAATTSRYGVAYTVLQAGSVALRFRTFKKDFSGTSEIQELTPRDARAPRVSAVGDVFVVTWDDYAAGPGESIMAAVVSESGEILVPATPITSGATFARSHDTLSLGDRFVLLWVDDKDGNFELYAKVLDAGLREIEERVRITEDDADTLGPLAVLGESGRIGVLFDDWRSGTHHTYFTTLGCGTVRTTR